MHPAPRFFPTGLLLACLVLPAPAALGQPRPDERRDVLGRPLPWADGGGARLSARLVRGRLLYGEPVEVLVDTANPSPQGPYLRVRWGGPRPTALVELTTAAGEAVPFTRQALIESSSVEGDQHVLRLWPRGPFARGRYFAPGRYRLRVVVEGNKQGADALSWRGRLASRPFAFEVLPEGAAPADLVPEPFRRKAAALVRDLGADRFAAREAAEKGLIALGPDALPLLEGALGSKSLEVATRARHVVKAVLIPLLTELRGFHGYPYWHEGGPLLASFGKRAWAWVREQLGDEQARMLEAQAAAFGPVDPPRGGTDVGPADVARLVARLRDPDPAVRLRAVRSLPRTTNRELLRALAERLADPYFYWLRGPGDPAPFHPVAFEASEALAWQGKPAVAALLDFGRAKGHRAFRATVARVLGEIGPDRRGLEYLDGLLTTREPDPCYGALEALRKFGAAGVPLLVRTARDARQGPVARREALAGLADATNSPEVGPFLVKKLGERDNPEWLAAAADAAGHLRLRAALPELTRIARDEALDQNARASALRAVFETAGPEEAAPLGRELLAPAVHEGVRGVAMGLLAQRRRREAVPQILAALEDRSWYVRASADQALRLLADQPAGVGYDAANPDAGRWRAWWKQHGGGH